MCHLHEYLLFLVVSYIQVDFSIEKVLYSLVEGEETVKEIVELICLIGLKQVREVDVFSELTVGGN